MRSQAFSLLNPSPPRLCAPSSLTQRLQLRLRDDPHRRPTLMASKVEGGWVSRKDVLNLAEVAPFAPGLVNVVLDPQQSRKERVMGVATLNRQSPVAARVLDPDPLVRIDKFWLKSKLVKAMELRERLGKGGHCYRLCNGEGDGIPGIFIDRFGPSLFVLQVLAAGMDDLLTPLLQALESVVDQPQPTIVLRNDSPLRKTEGLGGDSEVVRGVLPPIGTVEVDLPLGPKMPLDLLHDPGPGLRMEAFGFHSSLLSLVRAGDKVLDLHSGPGVFGLQAASLGATVVCVDDSPSQVSRGERAADISELYERVSWVLASKPAKWAAQRKDSGLHDVICIDYPMVATTNAQLPPSKHNLSQLVRSALPLLKPGGVLGVTSRSWLLQSGGLHSLVSRACDEAGKTARLIAESGLPMDFPVPLGLPALANFHSGIYVVR